MEAIDWVAATKFPKTVNAAAFTSAGITFVCAEDIKEDPQHKGFLMPIGEWNRYRHYTYKEDREAEKIYIKDVSTVAPIADAPEAAERPLIYGEFELIKVEKHLIKQRHGGVKEATAEYWLCCNASGLCKYRKPFKVVKKATGKLFSRTPGARSGQVGAAVDRHRDGVITMELVSAGP